MCLSNEEFKDIMESHKNWLKNPYLGSKAVFTNTTFKDCDFSGYNLSKCEFKKCSFKNCTFNKVKLNNASIISSKFLYSCKITNSDLSGCTINKCYLHSTTIDNCLLIETKIEDTEFFECKIENILHLHRLSLKNIQSDYSTETMLDKIMLRPQKINLKISPVLILALEKYKNEQNGDK